MKIGFITACLPDLPIEEPVPWAAQTGYEALAVAAAWGSGFSSQGG